MRAFARSAGNNKGEINMEQKLQTAKILGYISDFAIVLIALWGILAIIQISKLTPCDGYPYDPNCNVSAIERAFFGLPNIIYLLLSIPFAIVGTISKHMRKNAEKQIAQHPQQQQIVQQQQIITVNVPVTQAPPIQPHIQVSQRLYCSFCGSEIEQAATFCTFCGRRQIGR